MITTEVPPYSKLALIYDQLMDHVDYRHWCRYVVSLFSLAPGRINSIVDMSCGTGQLCHFFDSKKYDVTGCDLSLKMLKKYKTGKRPPIACNAVQNCFKENSFDAVLFLYDSINYLMSESLVEKFFMESRRILKPGGLLIFDFVPESQCLTYYSNFHENEFWGETGYLRHSYYNTDEKIQNNEFTIIFGEERYFEHHKQKIYSTKIFKRLLNNAGFKIAGQFDGFTINDAEKDSERVHVAALKL